MKIQQIPLARIRVGDRLRPENPAYVKAIAENAAEEVGGVLTGIRSPVGLRPLNGVEGFDWDLVTGAHRYAAAKLLGLDTIPAVVERLNQDEAKLREIDENLIRYDLSELDRAVFLAERKVVFERLNPAHRHGGDRRSVQVDKLGDLKRFTTEAAEKLGLSERSIQRSIARHDGIPPELRRRIAGSWLANSGAQLDALLRVPAEDRLAVVDVMLHEPAEGEEPAPRTVGAALQALGKRPKAEAKDKAQSQLDQVMSMLKPLLRSDSMCQRLAEKLAGHDKMRAALIDVLHQRGDVEPIDGGAS